MYPDSAYYGPPLTISALGHVLQQGVSKCFRVYVSFANRTAESIITDDREPCRSCFDAALAWVGPVLRNPSTCHIH